MAELYGGVTKTLSCHFIKRTETVVKYGKSVLLIDQNWNLDGYPRYDMELKRDSAKEVRGWNSCFFMDPRGNTFLAEVSEQQFFHFQVHEICDKWWNVVQSGSILNCLVTCFGSANWFRFQWILMAGERHILSGLNARVGRSKKRALKTPGRRMEWYRLKNQDNSATVLIVLLWSTLEKATILKVFRMPTTSLQDHCSPFTYISIRRDRWKESRLWTLQAITAAGVNRRMLAVRSKQQDVRSAIQTQKSNHTGGGGSTYGRVRE